MWKTWIGAGFVIPIAVVVVVSGRGVGEMRGPLMALE